MLAPERELGRRGVLSLQIEPPRAVERRLFALVRAVSQHERGQLVHGVLLPPGDRQPEDVDERMSHLVEEHEDHGAEQGVLHLRLAGRVGREAPGQMLHELEAHRDLLGRRVVEGVDVAAGIEPDSDPDRDDQRVIQIGRDRLDELGFGQSSVHRLELAQRGGLGDHEPRRVVAGATRPLRVHPPDTCRSKARDHRSQRVCVLVEAVDAREPIGHMVVVAVGGRHHDQRHLLAVDHTKGLGDPRRQTVDVAGLGDPIDLDFQVGDRLVEQLLAVGPRLLERVHHDRRGLVRAARRQYRHPILDVGRDEPVGGHAEADVHLVVVVALPVARLRHGIGHHRGEGVPSHHEREAEPESGACRHVVSCLLRCRVARL